MTSELVRETSGLVRDVGAGQTSGLVRDDVRAGER